MSAADQRMKVLGLLKQLSTGMFRLDPEWCKRHGHEQITDEELDDLLGQLNVAIHDIETETTA
jgi:hypothetical protein